MFKLITPVGSYSGNSIVSLWLSLPPLKFGYKCEEFNSLFVSYSSNKVLDLTL
jgi:hypothetical protein